MSPELHVRILAKAAADRVLFAALPLTCRIMLLCAVVLVVQSLVPGAARRSMAEPDTFDMAEVPTLVDETTNPTDATDVTDATDAEPLTDPVLEAARARAPKPIRPAPSPCRTSVQALVNAAAPGSTLTLPPCIYRETVTISKPLTLVGGPGVEIRGSDIWAQWTRSGTTWVSAIAVPPLAAWQDPTRCKAGTGDRCLWPEQVFVDGHPLQPVAPGVTPAPGQFALVSTTDRRVRLGQDPIGHTVEVSVRARWIITGSDHVTIQRLTMRHAGNDALTGGVGNDGYSDWTLQDSLASDAHGADVSIVRGSAVRVLHNDIGRGGDMGVHGTLVSQGLIQGNRLHHNGVDGFNTDWGAGGLKVTEVNGLALDQNEVDANTGPGLWCDIACRAVTISSNRVHHNSEAGIFFEISDGASIHDNAVWENGWGRAIWGWGAGILISSSANAQVFNNTLAWNASGISVVAMSRPDQPPAGPVGNFVHNNTIIRNVVTGDFSRTYWSNLSLAWLTDGSGGLYDPGSNNRGASNLYWDDLAEDLSVRFSWRTQYLHLADFETTPGDSSGRYLSDHEKDQALSGRGIPLVPDTHS